MPLLVSDGSLRAWEICFPESAGFSLFTQVAAGYRLVAPTESESGVCCDELRCFRRLPVRLHPRARARVCTCVCVRFPARHCASKHNPWQPISVGSHRYAHRSRCLLTNLTLTSRNPTLANLSNARSLGISVRGHIGPVLHIGLSTWTRRTVCTSG